MTFYFICDQDRKTSLTVADAVDYNGFPADRSKTGGWVPAALILGKLIIFLIWHTFGYFLLVHDNYVRS